ncbi:MAG: AAA family ATPase [Caldilineaceae bacterium]
MITQIEIDGFKTLQKVILPLRPFQVFAGPNNVGKSNLFDALRLLSLLPDHDLPKILQSIRGEPYELFSQQSNGTYAKRMRLAVELLLDNQFQDEFEGEVKLKRNWLRYEVEIERDDGDNGARLQIASEQLLLKLSDERLPWPVSRAFRETYLRFPRRNAPYISLNESGEMIVHQDGAERGRPRTMRRGTRQSILFVIRDASEFPHICAVRNELQRWRFVHLEPEVMRGPNAVDGPDQLDSNGKYLAATLQRIIKADPSMQAEISAWVRQFITGARELHVQHLKELHQYLVELQTQDGRRFSSRVLSDGTLRLLGLLALQYDPNQAGVICLEEPENGVHPRRLETVVSLLKGMATNPEATDFPLDDLQPLRQILMNTHSPHLVDQLQPEDLVLVEAVERFAQNGKAPERHTIYRPVVPPIWGPLLASPNHEATKERLHRLLEEQELGALWTHGALGGIP